VSPRLVLFVGLEEAPSAHIVAMNNGHECRLADWAAGRREAAHAELDRVFDELLERPRCDRTPSGLCACTHVRRAA
jgi:hypothetical protein